MGVGGRNSIGIRVTAVQLLAPRGREEAADSLKVNPLVEGRTVSVNKGGPTGGGGQFQVGCEFDGR